MKFILRRSAVDYVPYRWHPATDQRQDAADTWVNSQLPLALITGLSTGIDSMPLGSLLTLVKISGK